MKFFKSIFYTFTTWGLAAFLNALLGGTVLSYFSTELNDWPSSACMVFFFSLLLSIPGAFVFWIVLLFKWEQEGLFRSLMKTGFIIAGLSSPMVYMFQLGMEKGQQLFLSICIVIAAIASVMMHHSFFSAIAVNKNRTL